MRLRDEEHQWRKDTILEWVVNIYIQTGTPVSSQCIKERCRLDYSAATIRHILAELEDEGLLTHPHTSAGRMPTAAGYRYYVDHLMYQIQLLEEEKRRIREEYEQHLNNLTEILDRTSAVIAEVTRCTGIVSDHQTGRIHLRGTSHLIEVVDERDLRVLKDILAALEEKEILLEMINRDLESKMAIYIGHELRLRGMEHCSLAVCGYETPRGGKGRLAVLGPTRMNYSKVLSTLDYVSDLLCSLGSEEQGQEVAG